MKSHTPSAQTQRVAASLSASRRGMTLANRAYYWCKPLIPASARYAMRRVRAGFKLTKTANWPISASAGRRPPDWTGWPCGKQFAFVLTHDVESRFGLRRALHLAAVETKHGFRSSFNFVPEGDYEDSAFVRARLLCEGFEVGVHDLRHDGSLFSSHAAFSKAAKRINRYLKEWSANGFRSGFMFHNLEWIKELNIQYDASTFDTDPFEAQPEGTDTIFPFWVPRENGGGFVELPYTLAQDATMFVILRQKSIELWKRKIDWIAQHGGMALLNVHPDYTAFPSDRPRNCEYPVALYEELLEYVQKTYANAFWHALPAEVAKFFKNARLIRQSPACAVNKAA